MFWNLNQFKWYYNKKPHTYTYIWQNIDTVKSSTNITTMNID